MIQSAEATALQIIDILRGGLGVAGSPQSLELSLQQIRDLLVEMVAGELDLSTSTPATLDPALGAVVGTEVAASHGDHRHALANVATSSGLAGAQADITTLQSDVAAVETSVAAVGTQVAITSDRRVTLGAEITQATKPGGTAQACCWDSKGKNFFVGASAVGNTVRAYPFDGAAFSAPVVLTFTTAIQGLAISPSDAHVACALLGTPFIELFPWSGTAWGGGITPGVTPPGGGASTSIAFNPAGTFVALGRNANAGAPEVIVYPWNGSVLGSAISLPSKGVNVHGVAWSPDGDYLFVAWTSSPFVSAFPFDGASFGTEINPASVPTATGVGPHAIGASADGRWVGVAGGSDATGRIWLYPWTAGAFGTPIKANPGGATDSVVFAPDAAFIASCGAISPFAHVVPIQTSGAGTTLGTAVGLTISGSPSECFDVAFPATGAYIGQVNNGTTKFGAQVGTRAFGF